MNGWGISSLFLWSLGASVRRHCRGQSPWPPWSALVKAKLMNPTPRNRGSMAWCPRPQRHQHLPPHQLPPRCLPWNPTVWATGCRISSLRWLPVALPNQRLGWCCQRPWASGRCFRPWCHVGCPSQDHRAAVQHQLDVVAACCPYLGPQSLGSLCSWLRQQWPGSSWGCSSTKKWAT